MLSDRFDQTLTVKRVVFVVARPYLHPAVPSHPSQQERRILEETVAPLTPRSSALPSPSRGEVVSSTAEPQDTIVRSLADWERKQELLEKQSVNGSLVCLLETCSGG